jgi:hypothetical protein
LLRRFRLRSVSYADKSLLAMTATIFAHPATGLRIRFSNSPPCTDTASRSRRGFAREVCFEFLPLKIQRAQGMPGA